jgi:hypothetical protein
LPAENFNGDSASPLPCAALLPRPWLPKLLLRPPPWAFKKAAKASCGGGASPLPTPPRPRLPLRLRLLPAALLPPTLLRPRLLLRPLPLSVSPVSFLRLRSTLLLALT